MVCEMVGDETKHNGLSTLDALHEATNAFASTTSTAYQKTIHKHASPDDHQYHDLFLQRQRNACVDTQSANGHVQLRSTMGNLTGDRFVQSAFALTYRRSISRYTAGRLVRSVVARRLLRKLPWVEDSQRRRHFHSRLRRRSAGRPPCRDRPQFCAIARGPQIRELRRQGSRVPVGGTGQRGVRAEYGKSRNRSIEPLGGRRGSAKGRRRD